MRDLEITYPGTNNFSDFTFDPFGKNVKIVETTAGSVTSTKQFVWSFGTKPKESRDGSSTIVSQYFGFGQMDATTTKRPYCRNHLGSVTEVTDNTGVLQGQQNFDAFGRSTQLQGSYVPDFGYAGYYFHARSGLNLTLTRAFSPALGRFINRDPIEEDGGTNLYAYIGNMPILWTDRTGLLRDGRFGDGSDGNAVPGGGLGPMPNPDLGLIGAGLGIGAGVGTGSAAAGSGVPMISIIGGLVAGTYGELRKAGASQAHHIIQDSKVRDVPGYKRGNAPSVQLKYPDHLKATNEQCESRAKMGADPSSAFSPGTYGFERQIAYNALRQAGIPAEVASQLIGMADQYFGGLGIGPNTKLP